jgi:heme ABC exporter ATP-binding subunit CcmA
MLGYIAAPAMDASLFVLEYSHVSAEPIRLQIDRVSKTYGSRQVLRSVSADLVCGDKLLVVGRNGAGKSTLLRIIAGLLRPTQGVVHFLQGNTIVSGEARRHAFGFVGPDVRLYRELTAREHLRFVTQVRGLPENSSTFASALDLVGLAGREDEPVGDYSTGMRQRLQYALAVLHQPRVLLLDEPAANLDEAGIAVVGNIVEHVARTGIIVIATNDARDMRYGNLVLPLDTTVEG